MNPVRKFTTSDWQCYSGAEKFLNGSEPLALDIELNGENTCTILADRNGLELHITGPEEQNFWLKETKLTQLRAEGELRALQKMIEKDYTYAPDLAYELDHPTVEVFKGFTWLCN